MSTIPAVKSPHLDAPPPKAVEALYTQAKTDKPTADWVVKLEKFYIKQDALEGKTR